jgi:hypothetical protein
MSIESRCCCRYWRPTTHCRGIETGSTRRIRLIAGFVLLLSVVLAPRLSRADIIGAPITAGGYRFINFDPTLTGNAVGSNVNGISNTGQTVGTLVDGNNASTFVNFTGTPGTTTQLNTGAGQTAFGINSAGDVVGGNGATAFILPHGGSPVTPPGLGGAAFAFGINDMGNIVGQYLAPSGASPGFILSNAGNPVFTTVNAPSGPDIVFAQGISNNGHVAGFYVGIDGQDHGFITNMTGTGTITGTAIADPIIPNVPGEPGATFLFSQLLGINDGGLVVGYYGDSTTSQHGFFYNTMTGAYTFLDDPSAQFDNGVEVTQITGINNVGEIAGFYSDAGGIAHSFVACPSGMTCPGFAVSSVPEPSSLVLTGLSWGVLGLIDFCGRRKPRAT